MFSRHSALLQIPSKFFPVMDNPLKFSKDDVRKQLSDLGYSNIEGRQLDEFCEDLRRLIKYEEKKQNIGRKLEELEEMEQNLTENKENEYTTPLAPKVCHF